MIIWKNQNYSCLVIFFSDWGCQKKLTFDIFLLSKKRNVSSPELCDICATCFVSTKYNINSFFNFNQHDSFFRIKSQNGAVSSFPALQLFVSVTNQNAELPSCAFWLVENTKSWRDGTLEMASTTWKLSGGLLHFSKFRNRNKINLFYSRKADGQAFRSANVR